MVGQFTSSLLEEQCSGPRARTAIVRVAPQGTAGAPGSSYGLSVIRGCSSVLPRVADALLHVCSVRLEAAVVGTTPPPFVR